MERLSNKEQIVEYELRPEMAAFITLADALLEHKTPDSRLSFVDIVAQAEQKDIIEEIRQMRIGELLLKDDEQMAIESDGSYYPQLDWRRQNSDLGTASVRAYGWQVDKVRYGDDSYKLYEGEHDKVRELSLCFHYLFSDEYAVEKLVLYGATSSRGLPSISRSLYIPEYAESGYEGHDFKTLADVTSRDVLDFMNIVARTVGDEPESFAEYQRRVSRQ